MKKIVSFFVIVFVLISNINVLAYEDGLTLFERQFYLNSAIEKLLQSDEYRLTGEWIDDTFYVVAEIYLPIIPEEEIWASELGKEFAESIIKVYQSIYRVWKDPIILRFSTNEFDMELKKGFQISRHGNVDVVSLMDSGIEVFAIDVH